MTASHDSTAIIWDLSYLPASLSARTPIAPGPSTARRQTLRFDAPVHNAQFHPRHSGIVLATLSSGVVLIDLREGGGKWVLEHEEEEPEDDAMDQDGEQDRRAKKG